MKEFVVNEYITLKLEDGKTNIYVNGSLFLHCKHILLVNPQDHPEASEINSIDDIPEIMKFDHKPKELGISPETEFWGHCKHGLSMIMTLD